MYHHDTYKYYAIILALHTAMTQYFSSFRKYI